MRNDQLDSSSGKLFVTPVTREQMETFLFRSPDILEKLYNMVNEPKALHKAVDHLAELQRSSVDEKEKIYHYLVCYIVNPWVLIRLNDQLGLEIEGVK